MNLNEVGVHERLAHHRPDATRYTTSHSQYLRFATAGLAISWCNGAAAERNIGLVKLPSNMKEDIGLASCLLSLRLAV